METIAITKSRNGWPRLFEASSWLDNFMSSPLDEYFNFSKVSDVPAINVNEEPQKYGLMIAAPGLEKKDFKVGIADGIMTIAAKKEENEEHHSKYNRREYNYSSWSRSFTLPDDANESAIKAEYKNGELRIDVPRATKKLSAKEKTIQIN
jgi:HSP20 family protein